MSDKGNMNDKVQDALAQNAHRARVAARVISDRLITTAEDAVRAQRRKAARTAILRSVLLVALWVFVCWAEASGLIDPRLGAAVVGGATSLWSFHMGAWVQAHFGRV